MKDLTPLFKTLETAKRMPLGHIKALCNQLYIDVGLMNKWDTSPRIPCEEPSPEAIEKAQAAVQKLFNSFKVKPYLKFDKNDFRVCSISEDQYAALQAKYEEVLQANGAYDFANLARQFIKDVEALRLALIIGPSPELSAAIEGIKTSYTDLIEKKEAAA